MATTKNITLSEFQLPITIQAEKKGGFTATSHLWRDCYAQGDTIEEVLQEATAVASSLIELYEEEGMNIPLKKKEEKKHSLNDLHLDIPIIVSNI